MIYWDNAASMRMLPGAIEVLEKSFSEDYANLSSPHSLGRDLAKRVEKARWELLELLKASSEYDLLFVSSATEGNNQIISNFNKGGDVLYCPADHASITVPVGQMVSGDIVTKIAVAEDGQVDYEQLLEMVGGNTSLIILTHVNGQSGVINKVDEIAQEIKKRAPTAHIHVDGVQALGKIMVSLENGAIDSYVVSGHKLGGPKGIAALVYKKNVVIKPLLWGGGQEKGARSSTVAAPLVFSFLAAARDAISEVDKNLFRIEGLNASLRRKLEDCCEFPFELSKTSPYISTFIIPKISSDILMRHLERENIFISSKSACSSKKKGKDEVLSSLKIDEKLHKNIVRISFAYTSSEYEVDIFVAKFKTIVNQLNSIME